MNKYFLIYTLLLSVGSAFASTAADNPEDHPGPKGSAVQKLDSNIGNWTEDFDTKVGIITHTPTQVKMGFIITGEGIEMRAKFLNGVPLLAPLVLKRLSSREDFVKAMVVAGILQDLK